jgi:hypothetical protein
MVSAVAASTATRFLPQLPVPWRRRARVALSPSPLLPWRPLVVTVPAASRRPGDGEGRRRERKRRRARGTDQEEGLSVSSGEPRSPVPSLNHPISQFPRLRTPLSQDPGTLSLVGKLEMPDNSWKFKELMSSFSSKRESLMCVYVS